MFLRDVTANIVLFELNGRTDYSFMATMAQVTNVNQSYSDLNYS